MLGKIEIHWTNYSLNVDVAIVFITVVMTVAALNEEYDPYRDVYFNKNKTTPLEARELCRELGYDGLAVIRSVKAYKNALEVTEYYRSFNSEGIHIGASLCLSQGKFLWDDGITAEDSHERWGKIPPKRKPEKPYVIMGSKGVMWTKFPNTTLASLCGNYKTKAIRGTQHIGWQPNPRNPSLISVTNSANYFFFCISLCGRDLDDPCVAAEFNSDLLTCRIFRQGAYTDLIEHPATLTFVKT